MPNYLATCTLDPPSGFAQDSVVNTFAFHSEAALDAVKQASVMAEVASFYKDVPTGMTRTLGSYLAGHLQRDTAVNVVKLYEISDLTGRKIEDGGTPMGSPINQQTFTIAAAGSLDSLPTQVALVMTLRGRDALTNPVENAAGLRPRQRRSGRLFIGPFNLDAHDITGVNQLSRPVLDLRNTLLAAAEDLQDGVGTDGVIWSVWSRSQASMYGITSVEVDDSFDVLRSRQVVATTRSKRTFAPVPDIALGA